MFSLSTVMDAIATALPSSYSAVGYPVSSPNVPQAIVGYPQGPIEYDITAHAAGTTGKMQATIPVWFVVSRALDKAARDAVSVVISDTNSIKQAIEGDAPLRTVCDYATVTEVTIESVTINDIDYLAARFDVEVEG